MRPAVAAALAKLDARGSDPSPTDAAPKSEPGIRWESYWTKGACRSCGRKRVLLVYHVRPVRHASGRWSVISATCLDTEDCFQYGQAQRAKRSRRTGLFVLGQPKAPNAAPPFCRWCGEEIVIVDPAEYRRRSRNYHRGDEYEAGNQDCAILYGQSRTYEPRVAVYRREVAEHGVLACVDCGQVCAEPNPDATYPDKNLYMAVERVRWECDHDTPLEDGGPHVLDNLRCRCVSCHRAKTARENAARRARRALDKAQANG